MRTQASFYHHPIHSMLVAFPIGLWVFSFICDVISRNSSNSILWSDLAFYTMAAGVVGGIAAAVPGFIDFLGLRGQPMKRIATTHMVLNLAIVVLYVFNLGMRLNRPVEGSEPGILLSAVSLGLLAMSGWLGGSLVYVHGVGVARDGRETDHDRIDRVA